MVSIPENNQPDNLQDIPGLQSDVIKLLKEISTLMVRTKSNLRNDDSGNKYRYFSQEINQAVSNVANLELRMAIVAPMKAGKSTIINAIVGQDLLPSRNAAMTTIPTKIIFNAKRENPVLVLKPEILFVFQEIWDSLQTQMNTWENEVTSAKIAHYPHLRDLATKIKANQFNIDRETTEREKISQVLIKLNDIIRLANSFDPEQDFLAKLIDLPCIETPFWHSEASKDSQYLGDLVIVDTPGPNEAKDHLLLTAVVEQELKQSSIILIVLDFTQLNNQAAEAVKRQVQPVIDLIGKENLYVLVNKVDQRRKGDMTTEQVKDFVYADLNLSESNDSDRIFEISARQAFSATNFLLELQQNTSLDFTKIATGKALAQEVLGIDWKEELETIQVEELKKKANKLLRESGFTPFLTRAIKALRQSAALNCISSALNRCNGLLRILRSDLNLRINIIDQEAHKIKEKIAAINSDLENLELCCKKLASVNEFKNNLHTNISQIIKKLKQDSLVNIETYLPNKSDSEVDFEQAEYIKPEVALFANADKNDILPEFITDKLKERSEDIIEFSSENEARNFITKAASWSKIYSEDCLQIAGEKASNTIQQSQQELVKFSESVTKKITKKAFPLLNKAFEVKLSFPSNLSINNQLSFGNFQIGSATRQIQEYKTEKYRPWYFLWLIQLKRKVIVTKTESYYTVSFENIISEMNNSTEIGINKISQEISQYLDEEFQPRLDNYCTELNTYFSSYKNNLLQTKQDQEIVLTEKNAWIEKLNTLVSEAEQKLIESNNFSELTKQCL